MKLILFCAVDAEKLEKYLPSAIFIYMMAAMEVAERFNAPVLKTDEGLYPSVSSNLTASEI